MRAYYCDHFMLPLPAGHRFPMEKYALLRERLDATQDLVLAVPEAATSLHLERVHAHDHVVRVRDGLLSKEEVRRIGFPWSLELVERSLRSVGGTIGAARAALEDGVAANLAGGTHHAFSDHGEGFCVFNDVAVSVRMLQHELGIERCAVLDLDVHQGNGTAAIFADDETVFTLSVHGENNFPFRKERSDLDIELADGACDEPYLTAVERGLDAALGPDTEFAFFLAGADPFLGDRLGRLGVTKDGLHARDCLVFDRCEAFGIPVAVVMSGGYATHVTDTVDIHEATIRAATARVPVRAAP